MYYLALQYINRHQYYQVLKRDPLSLDLLADFLTIDIGSDAQGFLEWFKDPAHDAGSGNATDYSVEEGIMTIIPEWKPDYDECIRQGHFFAIKFDLVLEILRQWGPVYQARPPYIIITIVDDVVDVKGADTYVEDVSTAK